MVESEGFGRNEGALEKDVPIAGGQGIDDDGEREDAVDLGLERFHVVLEFESGALALAGGKGVVEAPGDDMLDH